MISAAQKSEKTNPVKAILWGAVIALVLAFFLLACGVWLLEKIQRSERLESFFVLFIQIICGFLGGYISSLSKQNCFVRALAATALFATVMLLISLLLVKISLLPALLSTLPILASGVVGGCVNALRTGRKKPRKLKRK